MYFTDAIGIGSNKDRLYYLREFDSLDEYLEYTLANADPNGSSHLEYSKGWHLSKSFGEAIQQAAHGWNAARPKVDQQVNIIRERIRELVTPMDVRIHDMVGYEPDIDRFVSGEIECMWDDMQIEAPHAGKVFTVLLDNCITSTQDANEMVKRGATVIALIEAFQLFGFELEIWVETTIGNLKNKNLHSTLIRIQRAGDRPDINAIMFPLANPDWQRRLSFGSCEGERSEIRDKFGFVEGGSYGTGRNGCHFGKRVDASIEISIERPDGAMVRDPAKWIIDQLRAQGVIDDDQ
jgi:hypothetical protein